MDSIVELDRRWAPSGEPHAVASDGTLLWVSSRATKRIDVIDIASWKKTDELEPPGMPWGMAYAADGLVMTCGETEDDLRRIRRYRRIGGFADEFRGCPADTGSHLTIFRGRVLLGQWYNKRLLSIDDEGHVVETYSSPHEIAGVTVVNDVVFTLGTDDEERGEYWITRIDTGDPSMPSIDVATVPFHARGLAWDGERWWTNHREADQIVSFALDS